MSVDASGNTFYEDQEEAWFNGGREWYMEQNCIKEGSKEAEELGIMGDFDPYQYWIYKDEQ